jgi:hypothetical protein
MLRKLQDLVDTRHSLATTHTSGHHAVFFIAAAKFME